MRWIFRFTPEAQKKLSAILKKKLPQSEPWLHVAVKTWSQRNPFAGIVVYVWDTRKVIYEHRFNNDVLDPKNFTKDKGWQRALDNRQPLVGGRKDVNEFFEFGPEFDASHGSAFDGKDRVKQTDLYKRRMKKSFNAGNESDLSDAAEYGGKIDLTKHEVHWMHDNEDKKFGIICEDNMCYMVDETGEMLDLDDDYDSLINFYQLMACEADGGINSLYITNAKQCTIINSAKPVDINGIMLSWDPHGGIYFHGKTAKLKELQKLIKEKTNFAEQ